MPTYCYTNDRGETVERYYAPESAPLSVIENGERYDRDLRAEMPQAGRVRRGNPTRVAPKWDPHFRRHTPQGWPIPQNEAEIRSYARDNNLETPS